MREEVSILLIVTGPRVRFATSNFCYNNGFAGLWGGALLVQNPLAGKSKQFTPEREF